MSERVYSAVVYMAPRTYYALDVKAGNLIDAATIATNACREANLLWRVVRLSEMSKEADEAPLTLSEDVTT